MEVREWLSPADLEGWLGSAWLQALPTTIEEPFGLVALLAAALSLAPGSRETAERMAASARRAVFA